MKRKNSERKNVNPSVIEEVRKLIEDRNSKLQIAEELGIPESDLMTRLNKETIAHSLGRYKCTFTPKVIV